MPDDRRRVGTVYVLHVGAMLPLPGPLPVQASCPCHNGSAASQVAGLSTNADAASVREVMAGPLSARSCTRDTVPARLLVFRFAGKKAWLAATPW